MSSRPSHDRFPPNSGFGRGNLRKFQGNLGLWNIIIWPDPSIECWTGWICTSWNPIPKAQTGTVSLQAFWRPQLPGRVPLRANCSWDSKKKTKTNSLPLQKWMVGQLLAFWVCPSCFPRKWGNVSFMFLFCSNTMQYLGIPDKITY